MTSDRWEQNNLDYGQNRSVVLYTSGLNILSGLYGLTVWLYWQYDEVINLLDWFDLLTEKHVGVANDPEKNLSDCFAVLNKLPI
jgi:hypothetical protein